LTERVPVTEQMPVDWAKKLAQSKGSGSEEFFFSMVRHRKIYLICRVFTQSNESLFGMSFETLGARLNGYFSSAQVGALPRIQHLSIESTRSSVLASIKKKLRLTPETV